MKTIRRIAPALVVLVVLVVAALAIGLLDRGGQGAKNVPLTDNSPNAGLSNDELITLAINNMKALQSYHFEFKGGMPSAEVRMSSNLSIVGDVQLHGKGARWTVRDEGGGVSGGLGGMNFDVGTSGIDGIRATYGHWYESYDGGKTWMPPSSGDSQLSFLLLWLDCRWGSLFEEEPSASDPTICESLAREVDYADGTPRLELIDGAVTRHMVGTYGEGQAGESGAGVKVDLWVSTDITPTLRRLSVAGSNKLYGNIVEQANEVAFSPDGKWLAAAHGRSMDGTVRLYDLESPGAPQRKLTAGTISLESVDFSPDGKQLAAAGQFLFTWDLTGPDSDPVTHTLNADVYHIAFQPNGEVLAAGTSSGIYLLDPQDAEATPTLLPLSDNANRRDNLRALAFSQDGQMLAVSTYLWDDSTGEIVIYDLSDPEKAPQRLHLDDAAEAVALSKDGQFLAAVGSGIGSDNPGSIDLWDLRSPEAPVVTLPGRAGDDPAIAFSPDDKWLVTFGDDYKAHVWDLSLLKEAPAAPTPAAKLGSGDARMTDIRFSRDGKRLAVAKEDGSVLVWKTDEVRAGQQSVEVDPQVFEEKNVVVDKPFTLTWTWSRFNEDFGEVEPPPADTIKKP
jgi:WD40 repeat protein